MMTEDTAYFDWLKEGGRIRTSARAVILDRDAKRILIEKNVGMGSPFFNFVGGGVQLGETMRRCLEREVAEETNAAIAEAKYLFVVENFIPFQGETRHSLEHYFEVVLDRSDVMATNKGMQYEWRAIGELADIDLRPAVVRDCIIDGSYRRLRHLVSRAEGG